MQRIDRKTAVSDLLTLSRDLDSITRDLKGFEWVSDEKLGVLTRKHVADILDRYLSAKLSEKQVTDWANALGGRDDIEFDRSNKRAVEDAIFLLANPEIKSAITHSLAKKIKAQLGL